MYQRRLHPRQRQAIKKGLVLTRRVGESIECDLPDGGTIIATIVASDDGGAKVHLHAPQDVHILRSELRGQPRRPTAA